MGYVDFNNWVQGKDIFGFDKDRNRPQQDRTELDELPIDDVSSSVVMEYLGKMILPTREPLLEFDTQVRWGEGPGAIRVNLSPLGSFKAIIRKNINDLEGNPIWICKEVLPLIYRKHESEDNLSIDLFNHVQTIDEMPLDSPAGHFDNLEAFVGRLADRVKKLAPPIFVFEGVKKMTDNHYLIYMSCRGGGTGAPDNQRLNEFVINISFDPKRGILKNFGYNVQSSMRGYTWEIQPSEWEEYYTPTQKPDEIINATIAALSTY
jgi:hypothetical protein